MIVKKFNYTGLDQTFTVPAGVTSIFIQAWGAGGGSRDGGANGSGGGPGGYSEGLLAVTPGQVLKVIVGQGGIPWSILPTYGGGGAGGPTFNGEIFVGCSGGGRSAVRLSDNTEIITAGGGGGGAGSNNEGPTRGGPGGGINGVNADNAIACYLIMQGKGGTQVAGGAGGSGWQAYNNGLPGTAFTGGTGGGGSQIAANAGGGGGGGGGYFGGGGGAGEAAAGLGCPPSPTAQDASGGGGSGYIGGVSSGITLSSVITSNTPPNSSSPNYIAGVGMAIKGSMNAGGNGLVVFSYPETLTLNKSVDKNYTNIGSTLTYSIVLQNTSTDTLTNVQFVDTIPTGTTFIPNSLSINGTPTIGNPNSPGINLGDFSAKAINTITFQVIVSSTVPIANTIANIAIGNYTGSTIPYNSNTVSTTISSAILSSTKISKNYATIGDIITYTIPIKNSGNTSATKVLFIDTIPNGTTLITNSLKQDATVLTGLSPNPPGATLPNDIGGGKTSTVTFQVRITTIPSPNPIQNYASMIFQYTIDRSTVPNIMGTSSSNTNLATTFINRVELGMTKVVNKNYATLNDELTYTITIPNTGNTTAYAVIFKDTIPTGTTFVSNSFTLNGVVLTGKTPASPGVNIGTIPAGGMFTVSFKVTVNTIPSPNRINNAATTTFNYQVDPSITTRTVGSSNSNIVTTTVTRTAIISPTKSVDLAGAFIGDTATYTVVLKNTGTTTAANVFFSDTMPNGTSFVTNSVKINGVTITGGTLTPPPGVSIPNLGVNRTATLTFKVTVDTVPSPNPTLNIGTASYSYTDTASGTSGSGTNNTNIVPLQVYPDSNPFKTVDKQFATVGDTLTYTLGWINSSPAQQTNVVFVDTIPSGTTFVANSVTVRGVSRPGTTVTAPNGLNTLTLPVGQLVTVTFKVVINTIPTINPIPNDTTVIYSTTLSAVKQSDVSNIITTQVNYANLIGGTKGVDKNFATVGDTLTYTMTIANNGVSPAENVIFFDTIPNGTSFIDGSVVINGVTIPGENPDPSLGGVNIGTISSGSITTIVFKVSVDAFPSPNPIPNSASFNGYYISDLIFGTTISVGANTNYVFSKVNFADLSNPIKGVDRAFADIPTTLTYTITITNTGNITANHVVFVDTVPVGTDFVQNSFTVNGVTINSANPNPPGINIGTVPAGGTFTVSFKVTTNSIPTTNPIPNTGTVGYDFIVDPTLLTTSSGTQNTNTVDTKVNHADLSNIIKFTDTQYGQCGDIITYTISIPNTGSADALNVVLKDTVPNGTIYVPNSLQVDGNPVGGTPANILVGTVPAGDTSVVTFKVQINC